MVEKIPVNDTVIYALARLVDDAQKERRDPSHSDIEFTINRFGLSDGDPNKEGQPVGKAKRVRALLTWAIENKPDMAERFAVGLIIATVKACGGFREGSPNYVGRDEIKNLTDALKTVGISLGKDGSLAPLTLESLSRKDLTEALELYVKRAKKGIEDAALVVGASKDLMEAVVVHVLQELWGSYPTTANFPTLLGQAFTALDMATPANKEIKGEHPRKNLERKMYELACAINRLRNKQGTDHGRPWLPNLTKEEARSAIEFIGIISELVLLSFVVRRKTSG